MSGASRTTRYLYPALAGTIAFVALALLVLLAAASTNSEFFDRYFSLLYQVNLTIGVLLILTVGGLAIAILIRLRQRRFGTRLMAKLAFFFAVVGVLPGAILYLVSLQFVSRSIESWFNVSVEAALEAGLSLGRTTMDSSLTVLQGKARVMAGQLTPQLSAAPAKRRADAAQPMLTRMREQFGVQEAVIMTEGGIVLASAHAPGIEPRHAEPPPAIAFEEARTEHGFGSIEGGIEEESSSWRAPQGASPPPAQRQPFRLQTLTAIRTPDQTLYLQVTETVPETLSRNATAVQSAYREYQEIAFGRIGLRKMYLGTLTLALFFAIFVAVALALLLGRQLARPLLMLMRGTQEVADGDLSPKPYLSTRDELGVLTQQFSQMTRQLADARRAVEHNRGALEASKAYLESILSNLTAGVFVFDAGFRLSTANAGAERIFQKSFDSVLGQPLQTVTALADFAGAIEQAFNEQAADEQLGGTGHWQKQFELSLPGADEPLILLARGTRLPAADAGDRGYVVVFDDISDVISAQRAAAWGEVARRLAHEIKNPLTPIQLAAERLKMKLEDKLAPPDAEILRRSATTIVNQVAAMKRMVDDFRDYARLPPLQPQPLQLNALIAEVLNLYGIDDVRRCEHSVIRCTLDETLPPIEGDPTQLRQVIHNLLQNAQDAVAENTASGRDSGSVTVRTEAVEYGSNAETAQRAVRLVVTDNGPGFAPRILNRAFEPYVTTKSKGTGLGLAMVKKIVDEHGARIELRNLSDSTSNVRGAQIAILFTRLTQLPPA